MLLRVDRGKITAEIKRGLQRKIAVVMGGRRHSSDATAVGNRKQNTWVRGVPFFRPAQGTQGLFPAVCYSCSVDGLKDLACKIK